MQDWDWTDTDQALAERLQKQLPEAIFDSHAHVYRVETVGCAPDSMLGRGPAVVGVDEWRAWSDRQFGAGRTCGGMILPFPFRGADAGVVNAEMLEALKEADGCCGAMYVTPEMTRADAESLLATGHFAGFKPYHFASADEPIFQASIESFVPEWVWELANERGLAIVLHMVRDRALADPKNQEQIIGKCKRYPNMKLVLAHAARGFHAPNTVESIHVLRGLQNVWFDTAAVCEAAAIAAILHEFGPRKVIWGSDYPVSEQRGRCVTVGDSFAWVNPEWVDNSSKKMAVNAAPVGLENVRAVLEAADICHLNDQDLADVFCHNARRVFGLAEETSGAGQALYEHAKHRIPAGTHLLSKRPEMLAPDQWPAYFRESRGCEAWDMDGRHYYDFGANAVGAALLGFRDPDVTRAVQRRIAMGSLSTLNPPEEVELADRLCEIHPWAECVRMARTGGEVATVAIRIARATTRRSKIAVCGYHGWHDWYLAANLGENDALDGHLLAGLNPLGVPRELQGTVLTFTYNNREQLQDIIDKHGDSLAAVIMEPSRFEDPEEGFLESVRDAAHGAGALLIFDEITIGWRRRFGGVHLDLGVNPDMALFGKTTGNGHPMAAVIGTEAAMVGARSSFISSSYWTESVGPVAALATLDKMQAVDASAHVDRMGTIIMRTITDAAARHGISLHIKGFPCVHVIIFEHEEAQALKTLYVQLLLERGILGGGQICTTYAHNEENIAIFGAALDEVFAEMAEAIDQGNIASRLKGPVAHTGFKRLL